MLHKKAEHKDKVSNCWKHLKGNCEFGDDLCWFTQSDISNIDESTDVKCNIYEKTLEHVNYLMHHKKLDHLISVPRCKNLVNNRCSFGDQNCWYRHDNEINNEENIFTPNQERSKFKIQ